MTRRSLGLPLALAGMALVGVTLFPALALGQNVAPNPEAPPPQAAPAPPPAAPQAADLAAELKALNGAFQNERKTYYARYRAAKTPEAKAKVDASLTDYLTKFEALAAKAKGTPFAVKALVAVFTTAQAIPRKNQAVRKALSGTLTTLLAEHANSPELEAIATRLEYLRYYIGNEASEKALRTLIDQSPHASVKAAALHTLGRILMRSSVSNPKAAAEARALFTRLTKNHPDTTYAKRAKAYFFELDNLQIGCVAPEIEGIDQHGKPLKLSTYRGKVVVIDFWGFW